MDFQFHFKEADYASANWAYIKRHWWRFVYAYRLPIGLTGASIAVILQYPNTWREIVWILAIGVGLIIYILITYRWYWYRQSQGFGQRLISATVDGESIRLRGARNEIVRQWREVTDIYESNRVFVFGSANSKILFLPKVAMSQPQINELHALISANAKGRVRLALPDRMNRKV